SFHNTTIVSLKLQQYFATIASLPTSSVSRSHYRFCSNVHDCILRRMGFGEQVLTQLSDTSVYEWIAVVFGIAQVLLAWKNNVLLYPAGIVSTAFSVYLLAGVHLYAESFLNLYYFGMSIYGWLH